MKYIKHFAYIYIYIYKILIFSSLLCILSNTHIYSIHKIVGTKHIRLMVAPLSIKDFAALVEKAIVMEKMKREVEGQCPQQP